MRPYIDEMKNNIAKVLNTDVANINVKATCCEKIGFVGRKEGAVAQAIVLLVKK